MRLYTPAEDSTWSLALNTPAEQALVATIAKRLGLAYQVQGDKAFLGYRLEARRASAPAPQESKMRARMGPHDLHAVVGGGRMSVYARDGELVWRCEARTQGTNGGPDVQGGDTPPGLYTAGRVTWTRPNEPIGIQHAFGPVFVDLVEMENQEAGRGRAGVGMHGGGTGLPDPLAPRQGWMPTHGCIRLANEDATRWARSVEQVAALRGTVWVSVV